MAAEAPSIEIPWFVEPEQVPLFERWAVANRDSEEGPDLETVRRLCDINAAFLLHYYTSIEDTEANLVRFNRWTPAQQFVYRVRQNLRRLGRPVRIIVLKARQQGISTLAEGLGYHRTSRSPHVTGMVSAQEGPGVEAVFGKFRTFYQSTPEILRPYADKFTIDEIRFGERGVPWSINHGSRMFCHTVALGGARKRESGKGRGATYQWWHGSEVAFWPMAERFVGAILPAIPKSAAGEVIFESTGNGIGNLFHAVWRRASEGWRLVRQPAGPPRWTCEVARRSSMWVPVFLSWLMEPRYAMAIPDGQDERGRIYYARNIDHDERRLVEEFGATLEQIEWRRSVLYDEHGGDLATFKREYPVTPDEAFEASSGKVFDGGAIRKYQDRIQASPDRPWIGSIVASEADGRPLLIEDPHGPLKVFRSPQPGRSYVIGADACEGRTSEGDRACAQVLCSASPVMEERWEQVAVFTERIDPDEFAEVVVLLGRYFGEAFVVAESNGPGQTTCLGLNRAEYYHRYRRREYDKVSGTWTTKWDWNTNTKTRRVMVGGLKRAIREMSIPLYDPDTVAEIEDWTYLESGGGPKKEGPGSAGGHDDRVVALGLALQGGILDSPEDDGESLEMAGGGDAVADEEMEPRGIVLKGPKAWAAQQEVEAGSLAWED